MAPKQQTVTVAGRKLKLTNLDKVLYPESGTTKAEVIEYFQTVATAMLPHVRRRAVTRKRWPDGPGTADKPKDAFFRKNLEDSAPAWVPRLGMQHSDHVNVYPLAEDEAVLAWFGQVAALELHVPQWRFDADVAPFIPQDQDGEPPVAERRNPDRLVLDLDPGPGTDVTDCAQVAHWCREILDDTGLPSVPVTSGSKGIHLYAALDGSYTSDQVSEVAKELARSLEADHPKEVVSQMKKTARRGKVFIDWSQNSANKTTVAPYSLRGRPQPWVAAPRTWEELDDPELGQLTFREVMERLADGIDPLADFARYTEHDDADCPAVAKPESKKAQEKTKDIEDALTKYRSMRDATKTPEPVPEASPAARDDDPIFVIQEHHATALHYDTRLERDGVLVSWAVPKGPPLSQGDQRLAVMTEDHPLEYAEFEGTIPKNEYGGGEVSIWDSGTVEIEKWEKKKVVFVLHGQPDGGLGGKPRRYALVQTDKKGKDWLIRLMKDQPKQSAKQQAEPSPMPDPLPSPMLATVGEPKDLHGDDWVFEAKWDGYRILSAVHNAGEQSSAVGLRSRNGKDYTTVFPELSELADLVPDGTVLDGEVVALNSSHRPDFGLLQRRGRLTKNREIERAAARIPVHYMVFDILHTAEHGDLTDLPYTERREILRKFVKSGKQVQVPDNLGVKLNNAMEVSEELKLEGVLAKRAHSTYKPGKRSDDWIKLKHDNHADVVIIGWRQGKGGRARTFGSLLLAVENEDGHLIYAGRVGTGFSDADLSELRGKLEKVTRKTPPIDDVPTKDASDATWVTPKLRAEVKHAGLTRDHRLRHPTWRKLL
ncbi:ATP-dependent DNA ligase [Nesterenkonia salmonea]|uniref:DNA ligase (ATP) n=1 Tax=Nesterenkonia salmonea TaxID=1804987 RepID=A0A5R9BF81_9MICC|nr:ATP-dependent DNA ligase [Nesterenkonia salmonea]TLP98580.1 ATP-dependent DNA ligase [Nesterenkonia salmonea]